jgi:prolyl-tRNA editing enzyme YbaK/EbsC (Cys-tRNA(Pro) deacylase)
MSSEASAPHPTTETDARQRGSAVLEALADGDLLAWVETHQVAARLVVPGVPTPTVATAAAALCVPPEAILKSLVFLVRGEPWLVIAAGEDRVRYRALAAAWGVTRRRVRLASPEEALAVTGYPVGAMPPFGHRRPLPTLIDARVARTSGTIYAGGGTRAALLELQIEELRRVTGARVADLTDPSDGGDRP